MECKTKVSLPIPETFTVHSDMIEAISIGSTALNILSTEEVIGKVYGVFDRTLNVLTKDKELLTLARKDVENSPTTILLDLPHSICMSAFGIRTGSSLIKSGQFIHISGSKLLVSLDKATLWKARRQVATNLTIKDVTRNCETANDVGRKYGKRGGLSALLEHLNALIKGETINAQEFNLYSRNALPYIIMLIEAVLSGKLGDVRTSVKRLIGLGPGLTPSCDDMLMGFMSSLLLVTEALGGDMYYAGEVNQVIASSVNGQTTLLSQKLLEHAAQGEVSELTHNVIGAIVGGTEKKVRKATSKLLAVGHSSGTDTLLGILLGFHVAVNMAYTLTNPTKVEK